MRIAFIVTRFPCLSETFILEQWRRLVADGHEVDVYADGTYQADEVELTHDERHNLARRLRHAPALEPAWAPRILHGSLLAARLLARSPGETLDALNPLRHGTLATSLRLLHHRAPFAGRGRSYDVIHAHFGPNGLLAAKHLEARSLAGNLVTTFYGYDVRRFPSGWGAEDWRPLQRRAARVLCLSDVMATELSQRGFDPSRLLVHHLGIDVARFTPPTDRPSPEPGARLLSVARLVPKKGIEYAIRAVAQVRRRHPHLVYTIVGDGPLRAELQALIGELGLAANVHLVGWKSHAEVAELMRTSHLFLCPSVTAADGDQEGTPTVLMEAQAMALPVLATDHAGIPEVVRHRETGLLVPERDQDALADAMIELMAHPESWPLMGEAGCRRVREEFNAARQHHRLLDIYRSLAKR
jgi:colanic acid/amylovoran biosynthesis glycosyltransferase